ncbi:DEAD-box ATP-dependent RNA helicase 17 [Citrus sinensis]|nr:DEAD-box ATP-dependent RNA helicase 17 [Citrus sinensis]
MIKMSKKKETVKEIFASCSFSSLGLHSTLCDQLRERLGFEAPTKVQAQAIPVILSGRHVLVNAATGTGKTVAYLAPIINHLQSYSPRIDRSSGTFALVLVPTRELCLQVYEILHKLLHRFHWIVPGYVMGGENRSKEKARLRKGEDFLHLFLFSLAWFDGSGIYGNVCISILVATPGRLLDHLKHTSSFLHTNLCWIIFDEADRILELGFGKEIEEILDILGSRNIGSIGEGNEVSNVKRQNLLLSATLNEKVNHLAKISLETPVLIGLDEKKLPEDKSHVRFGSLESDVKEEVEHPSTTMRSTTEDFKLPAQLVQRYVKVPCGSRLAVLLSILKHLFDTEVSQKVRLHGNMKQEDRITTFGAFKIEKKALLLSTDVAARGLDFPKVKCIIQYDSAGEATEYVHRVGRTARLGERGDSLLFLQPVEMDYLQDLEKHGVSLTEYPLLKVLDSFPLYGQKPRVKKFLTTESHPWILSLQNALESFIIHEVRLQSKMKKLAKDAFCSWVRAYTAHRGELKRIFTLKKLHLGHVAKSFALKEQPSLVGKSFQKQSKKRKRDQRQKGQSGKRKFPSKTNAK